jgi:hypothetical protein
MESDFALPWVVKIDRGGIYIGDARGNTVCTMVTLEVLPS